jgi:exopolysaccharide biosynthesis polyprenyl glycosylphosphotransferase
MILIPDVMAIFLSAITAYYLRFPNEVGLERETPSIAFLEYRLILLIVALFWVLTFVLTGNYKISHGTLVTLNLRAIVKKSIIFFFCLGFISFILKAEFSRSIFLIMLFSGLSYIFTFRLMIFFLILRPMIHSKKLSSGLMIIGPEKVEITKYSDWLMANRALGFKIVSRLVCGEIDRRWIEEFDRILKFNDVSEVLLLPGMETDPSFSKFIHYCVDLDIHVNWIPLDSGNLGYWLTPSPQEGIPFLTFEKSEISLSWRIIKRTFDLIFSISLIIILSPIYIIIAIAVLLSSGRPIIYSQSRVGLNGRSFKFYKFRTMVKGADKITGEVENIHERDHVLFKNRQDPRVTPIGRILRKYSLDELPQFFNVINNSMSVVGPRPALPREANIYNSIYERRLSAKPGVTGPWQISGRSDLDLQTSVALDLNYLVNWSFTRDLWIIIATIGAVFKGRGAY